MRVHGGRVPPVLTRPLPRRRLLVGAGVLAADAVVRAVTSPWASVATAGESADLRILQTVASVDAAAVDAYDAAIGLSVVAGAGTGVLSLFESARAHHVDHLAAYDDALNRLGGSALGVANEAVAAIFGPSSRSGPLRVVAEAMAEVENVAAQTCQLAVGLLEDAHARTLAAAVSGTEAQHQAALMVLASLAGGPGISLFTPGEGATADIPPETASVAIPNPTAPTDAARPPAEGAGP